MRSEDRWKKEGNKTYWNPEMKKEGYKKDETIEEDSPIKTILIGSAVALGGYGAWRSGMLKHAMKKGIKYAGDYRALSPTAMRDFKAWTKKDGVKGSIFRKGGLKNAVKSLKDDDFKGKEIYEKSLADIKDLRDTTKKNIKRKIEADKRPGPKTYTNTELSYDISTINKVSNQYKYDIQKRQAKEIMAKDIIKDYMQSPKKAKKEIKRNGYRTATLGDLVSYEEGRDGIKRFIPKSNTAALDEEALKKFQDFLEGVNVPSNNGRKMNMLNSGQYKNLAIDKNILIDEAGNVADLRNAANTRDAFMRSMANDFKIPLIGINPLKFTGMGKKGIRKPKYAVLSTESVQPGITGLQGDVKMKDVADRFGEAPVLVSNGKGYKFNDDEKAFQMFRDDLELRNTTYGENGITREANDLRKMANIKSRKYTDYTKSDSKIKQAVGKVGEVLDIGKQDATPYDFQKDAYESILAKVDPSTYIEKGFSKLSEKNIFNKGHGKVKGISDIYGTHMSVDGKELPLYIAMKRKTRLTEALDPNKSETIAEWFRQFFKGRDNLEEVNIGALNMYYAMERMNQALNPFGLALGLDSIGDTKSTIKNMILKRYLPVFLGIQAFQYVNMLSENDEGETLEQRNAKAIAGLDISIHKVKDATGLTSMFKKLSQLTPGNDQIGELPIINKLGLTRTAEETAEYYKSGMDPVRKGRYWNLGDTAYTGGKIQYWKPNWYQEKMADAEFSENKYGSRKEYFDNAWFTSPIKHFITDPYHYDEKHYYDRPYLMTSTAFENIPIFGPILSGTIGKVIKPQKKMHSEYWEALSNNSEVLQSSNAAIDNGSVLQSTKIAEEDNLRNAYNYSTDINGFININDLQSTNMREFSNNVQHGNINIMNPTLNAVQMRSLGTVSSSSSDGKEVYTTASGQQSIVDIDRNKIDSINEELSTKSLGSIPDAKYKDSEDEIAMMNRIVANGDIKFSEMKPNTIKNMLGDQYKTLADVLGIYGFGASTITGDIGSGEQRIDTSGYAYSFRKGFWDDELGGLGGELSEIFRRFNQKRRKDLDYINPVRNTMADWLPGEDYFTDFKHGDPFTKVAKGELRLPGTPYERVWGIEDPTKLRLDSSKIGKSQSDIVQAFLNNDIITDIEANNAIEQGEKIKDKVKKNWVKNEFAIDTDVKFNDEENVISGTYDARIKTLDGEAAANIKVVNQETLNEIKETGMAKQGHLEEMNYTLNSIGLNKGYINYVSRDNPEDRYTIGVDSDEEMYNQSLNKLQSARNTVLTKLENREISRGDLYKHIDRFRILADVAPYSDEYKNTEAILKASNMDAETKAQYDEIVKRKQAQTEANRTYEYRFKTANVDTIKTKITSVDGANVYVDINGEERKINLAGISVGVEGTVDEKEKIDKIKENLVEGKDVTLKVDADPLARDKTKSIKAVVIDSKGKNINKELLKNNLATAKEDDWSAPAVNARFNKVEMAMGSIWETIAHADTYFNTKFLQVRSAAEDYERKEVYGKNFKSWEHPIRDYLIPTINRTIARDGGILIGAFIGSMFGRKAYSKAVGAVVGAATITIGKVNKAFYEAKEGETWVPKERRKERELNEYIDALKFVKNQKLYNYYKEKALNEDNFDLDKYFEQKDKEKEQREERIKDLEKEKVESKKAYEEKREKVGEFANERPKVIPVNEGDIRHTLAVEHKKEMKKYHKQNERNNRNVQKERARLKEINEEISELKKADEGSFKEFMFNAKKRHLEKRLEAKTNIREKAKIDSNPKRDNSIDIGYDMRVKSKEKEIDKYNKTIDSLNDKISQEREDKNRKWKIRQYERKRKKAVLRKANSNQEYSEIIREKNTDIRYKTKVENEINKAKEIKEGSKKKIEEFDAELQNKKDDLRNDRQKITDINSEIESLKNHREVEILPENATKALEYKKQAESTMYGYDAGDPLTNILSALPKKDRDRMKYFLKAPEEERDRILEIVPKYLRRPLQSAWGMKVDDKEDLSVYFGKHQLPGEDWVGWNEDVDLDSVKVKMVNSEGLDKAEFNIWDDDVKKANEMGPIPLPNVNFRANAIDIRKRLMGLLGEMGVDNPDISFMYTGNGMDINMELEKDIKPQVEKDIEQGTFLR